MFTSTHQDGNGLMRIFQTCLLHQMQHPFRFGLVIATIERMQTTGRARQRRIHCRCCGQRNRTGSDIDLFRENIGKAAIHPGNNALLRTEVTAKLQGFQSRPLLPQSSRKNTQEQTDLGFTETVDRLHRVTDQKQGPAISVTPTGSKNQQQFILQPGGILKLINQNMLQIVIGAQQQLSGIVRSAKRLFRFQGNFRIVGLPLPAEHQPQLGDQHRQQLNQALQNRPLILSIGRPRQLADSEQAGNKLRGVYQCPQQLKHPLLGLFIFCAGGKPVLDVDRFAQFILPRQEKFSQRLPERQVCGLASR